VELAYRLDLAHRIAARHGGDELYAEIGLRPAGRLFARHETILRRAAAQAAAAARIAADADAHGIPLVALKFLALRLDGVAPDGVRHAGDLDFLVHERDLGRLATLLAGQGYRNPGYPFREGDHAIHLEHDSGPAVELHRHLPGVRLAPGAEPARLSDLDEAGLLVAAPGSSVRLPCRDVLVAHLIVHGLAQHGWSARSYPHLRMVADLADLGVRPHDAAVERAHRWIGDELTQAEVEALVRLVARLRDGDEGPLEQASPDEAEAVLLRHFVAAEIDDDYASFLRLKSAFRGGPASPRSLWVEIASTLFLSDLQIDLIYGLPRRRWGYLGWRLYRPIDLVVRSLRYAWAALRLAARLNTRRGNGPLVRP
jgi:hypothetical protein